MKKLSNNHNLCPTCHQDIREDPHDGLGGKNCPQCGQGISWRQAMRTKKLTPKQVKKVKSDDNVIWDRGAKADILKTYTDLHKGKIGLHWIWAAIEQIVLGTPESEVMDEYGWIPDPRLRRGGKRLRKGRDFDGYMVKWSDGDWHSYVWYNEQPPKHADWEIHRVKIYDLGVVK